MRTYCLQRERLQKNKLTQHQGPSFYCKCSGNSGVRSQRQCQALVVLKESVAWRAEVHGATRVGHSLATEEQQHLTSSLPSKDAHQHPLKEMLHLGFWKCGQVVARCNNGVNFTGSAARSRDRDIRETETSEKL